MTRIIHSAFVVQLILVALVEALEVRIITEPTPFSNKQIFDVNNIKLLVNSNQYIYPHSKNTFTIPKFQKDKNIIEVISNVYTYPFLMVDVLNGTARYEELNPHTMMTTKLQNSDTIRIKSLGRTNYLVIEQSNAISNFIFSGTGMMVIFGGLMFLCYKTLMPKLEEAQRAPESE